DTKKMPELLSATYRNGRWRKLMMNLPVQHQPYLLPGFARYMLEEWNRNHEGDQQLERVRVLWMKVVTAKPYEDETPAEEGVFVYPPEPPLRFRLTLDY